MADTILAIDPGSEQSGWIVYAPGAEGGPVQASRKESNEALLARLVPANPIGLLVVIEWTAPRGMLASAQLFEAMWWAGRFAQAAITAGARVERLGRDQVKLHLLGRRNGKDSMITAALVDRFGGIGGRRAAVGLKGSPGPLYGVKADVWAALAVAVTWADTGGVFE